MGRARSRAAATRSMAQTQPLGRPVAGRSRAGFRLASTAFRAGAQRYLRHTGNAIAYADAPSGFWIVRVVDLGFIVPISIATGVGLLRGSGTAIKAAYGVTAFLVLQAMSVLAMGVIMLVRQDPTATPTLLVALAPISLGLVVLTAILYASSPRQARVNAISRSR